MARPAARRPPRALPIRRALGVALVLACAGPAAAEDVEETCRAVTVIAQAFKADVGTWRDRLTRTDGVEVICPIRTVQFKRFFNVKVPDKDWRDRQRAGWNASVCNDRVWRPAIEAGWIILLSITAASGEGADIIASCD